MLTVRTIQRAVAAYHGILYEHIMGPNRSRRYAFPRQQAMWLSRKLTKLSYPQIGEKFLRHHTTILSGERRVNSCMAFGATRTQVLDIMGRLLEPDFIEAYKAAHAIGVGLYGLPVSDWRKTRANSYVPTLGLRGLRLRQWAP